MQNLTLHKPTYMPWEQAGLNSNAAALAVAQFGDTLLFPKIQLSHTFVFWLITSSLQELRRCYSTQLVPKACKSACVGSDSA